MYDDLAPPEEEVYGPGTDLLISLFAMAMLMLSIVGVDRQLGAIAQASSNAEYDRAVPNPPIPSVSRSATTVPPLKLASEQDMATLRAQLAESRLKNVDLATRTKAAEELAEARKRELETNRILLSQAAEKLAALNGRPAGYQVDLLQYDIPIGSLRRFFSTPEKIAVSLSEKARQRLRQSGATLGNDMNQVFIETYLPPAMLALLPASSPQDLINRIYVISAGAGQAYQRSLADVGIPLSCMTLTVRSFENSPAARKEVMSDARDATTAFEELLQFYRGLPEEQAEKENLRVSIRLGQQQGALCDNAKLKQILTTIR